MRRFRALAWAAPVLLLVMAPAAVVALVVTMGGGEAIQHAAAERLLEDGRFAEASAAFEAVLTERPDDPEALRGLATSAYRAGDLERAERTFARVVALAPDDQAMRNALSLVRVRQRAGRNP
jgi:Flp pilus assembly protein TadD